MHLDPRTLAIENLQQVKQLVLLTSLHDVDLQPNKGDIPMTVNLVSGLIVEGGKAKTRVLTVGKLVLG